MTTKANRACFNCFRFRYSSVSQDFLIVLLDIRLSVRRTAASLLLPLTGSSPTCRIMQHCSSTRPSVVLLSQPTSLSFSSALIRRWQHHRLQKEKKISMAGSGKRLCNSSQSGIPVVNASPKPTLQSPLQEYKQIASARDLKSSTATSLSVTTSVEWQ